MPELHGNTQGLSPSATRALERIYRRRVPLDVIATPELVRSLSDASRETGRQVGAIVHRSGAVEWVVVGDATKLFLPDVGRLRAAEGRFRGLRLVHTHLYNEAITKDDLVDLVRLRLDLVAALSMSGGEARTLSYAYNTPVRDEDADDARLPYRAVGPLPIARIDTDFGALVQALEDEFARRARTRKTEAKDGRAILVHVSDKRGDRRGERSAAERGEEGLRELEELARTAGVRAIDKVLQVREGVDPRTVLGKGKLDEVVLRAAELDAETLIFDQDLSPTQAANVAKHSDLKVIDRSQLILDIFAQRAESADGKLQVELAQLKYALPRLGLKDDSLSRLTGGIGGRGPGETKLEIGRRRAKERVSFLERQLERLARQRKQRRHRRARLDIPVVSIVGYTNAGKSTLLNSLCDAEVLAEDKLFATLDTRSRRLKFPEEREVVLVDTVGFIRELPPALFAAFRATFEEAADADLLLHVVDASDPAHDQHIATTEEVLAELDLGDVPRLLVWNKVDQLGDLARVGLGARHPGALLVSACDRGTLPPLLDAIASSLAGRWERSRAPWRDDAVEPPEGDAEATMQAEASLDEAPHELTTLDDLLGERRRGRRARARDDAGEVST